MAIMRALLRLYLCFLPIVSLSFCLERIENVAVNKSCKMSSVWVKADSCTFAVNGNTTGEYWGFSPVNCIHTSLNDRNTWWEVDLGRPYPVYSISVYPRESLFERMQNVIITVDGQHCYTFTTVKEDTSGKIDINCTSGVVNGRVIRVSRPGDSFESSVLNICEFQVWQCVSGTYGEGCSKTCGSGCKNSDCNATSGHCECLPGWKPPLCHIDCDSGTYGEACSKTCGSKCKNSVCNSTSGYCECLPGWKPPLCHLDCDSGTYGEACSKTCGSGCKNSVCNSTSGYCECLTGWKPPLCNLECDSGTYGEACSKTCGSGCKNSVCNSTSGYCECLPGWKPPLCHLECDSGTYGEACSKTCGSGCKNSVCNSTSGYCECLTAWKPPLCHLECDSGTYGEACTKTCGSGCKNSVCNSTSGYCECLPGWKPPLCHLENVAVNKTCNISSSLYVAGDSCTFAVNGQTTGEYSETGRRDCIHTGLTDKNTWWEVDLGRPYPVYSISVYPRRAYYGRMQNVVITVDGQHCYKFTTVQVDTSGKIDINCTSGVVNGRVIRVSRPSNSVESSLLNICEFQVWSCTLHLWGSQCDHKCGDCTDGAVCDKVTGHCPCKPGFKPPLCIQECDSGTYGEACSKTCGSGCKNSDCNTTSGHCECLPGWKPPPLCHIGCDSGTYGEACMKTCGSGCKNSDCNTTSGHCQCLPGWMPPLCHQGCPLHFWGSQCDRPCGHCIDGAVCDKATGHCICKPGFLPPLCTQENVALRKRCNVKSMSPSDNSCDKGVNGDTLSSELGCFESARMKGPWWEVDLGRPYPVYNITVWPREYNEHRLKGCVITVDGQHCYTFTSTPDFSSSGINISCTSGVINGRVVRVSSSQNTLYEKVAVINFCEIQVWSCAAQFWGSQCENTCKNCTEGAICDKVTGHCP